MRSTNRRLTSTKTATSKFRWRIYARKSPLLIIQTKYALTVATSE